jgi:hypothetical protein
MTRRELMLAAMASAGEGASFTPVQVQETFFLIDRTASVLVGGPHFHFHPYDYGPFDSDVYSELDSMARAGLVDISEGRYHPYSLTPKGYAEGRRSLDDLPDETSEFLHATVGWVRSLRFDQLVAAIYRDYPDMKVNSVFLQ